jgi:diacylglycerol O-acyltransferase / wax synthase
MGRTEWVTGRDDVFFFLEGATTPYHMASLATLEGPPPPHREIADAIAAKLPLLPRFRQRLGYAPFTHRPLWTEDRHFDIDFHVRPTTLTTPSGLQALVAELMEQHVNRFRPLWELWVIDTPGTDRFHVLFKVHHSMVDGVTGAHDIALLFDTSPQATGAAPMISSAGPPALSILADSIKDRATTPWRLGVASVRTRPGDVLRGSVTAVAAVGALVDASLHPAPRCFFNRAIGPNRVYRSVSAPLDDMKAIKNALHGTVNDVVLAVTAGGLRDLLLANGEDPASCPLRALIPVSIRSAGDGASSGNKVAGVLAPLPVDEPDPVRRFAIVHEAMERAKRSPQTAATSMVLDLPSVFPRSLSRRVAEFQRRQRFFNLSLTNVPGPEERLYLAGRPVLDLVPIPPLSANAGLIVGAFSYAGTMSFGLLADPDIVPDLSILADGIDRSIRQLVRSTSTGDRHEHHHRRSGTHAG